MHSGTLMKAFVPQRFHGDVAIRGTVSEVKPPIEIWRPYVRRDRYPSHRLRTREMMDPVPAAKIGSCSPASSTSSGRPLNRK